MTACQFHFAMQFAFFFFNDTATTEIYTLSLHDALPISTASSATWASGRRQLALSPCSASQSAALLATRKRSEEHTSELQSQSNLVCRLLLEKKKPDDQSAPLLAEHWIDRCCAEWHSWGD